ncbi:MAG: cytidine deaminase [Bacteroidales bacterium]|jgi:cytidine deaminase|nr:cytidine deaminase [Bacteroidales bacterium]
MNTVTLNIVYQEYAAAAEMDPQDQALVAAAIEAQKSSYAPYSKFNVGAAVRLEDGIIVKGSNQENSAYPSGLCAERTAMFAAGAAHPGKAMTAIAIAGGFNFGLDGTPCTPCGACRQVMAEYQMAGGKPMNVIMVGADKILKFNRVDDILPFIFDSFTEKK